MAKSKSTRKAKATRAARKEPTARRGGARKENPGESEEIVTGSAETAPRVIARATKPLSEMEPADRMTLASRQERAAYENRNNRTG